MHENQNKNNLSQTKEQYLKQCRIQSNKISNIKVHAKSEEMQWKQPLETVLIKVKGTLILYDT